MDTLEFDNLMAGDCLVTIRNIDTDYRIETGEFFVVSMREKGCLLLLDIAGREMHIHKESICGLNMSRFFNWMT